MLWWHYDKNYDDIVLPEKQGVFLPSSLRKFLEVLIRSKIKQNNIGQAIVYSTRPRSAIPPIRFGPGIEMDHIVGWTSYHSSALVSVSMKLIAKNNQ